MLCWTCPFFLQAGKKLVEEAKVVGSFGCSGHEMVQFGILKGGSRAKSRIPSLDFRRWASSGICLEESHENSLKKRAFLSAQYW